MSRSRPGRDYPMSTLALRLKLLTSQTLPKVTVVTARSAPVSSRGFGTRPRLWRSYTTWAATRPTVLSSV
jgi:hypothetical protein